jgi:hypothetical protein
MAPTSTLLADRPVESPVTGGSRPSDARSSQSRVGSLASSSPNSGGAKNKQQEEYASGVGESKNKDGTEENRPGSSGQTSGADKAAGRRQAKQILWVTGIEALLFLLTAAALPGVGWAWGGEHLGDAVGIGGLLGVVSVFLGDLTSERESWQLLVIGAPAAVMMVSVEVFAHSPSLWLAGIALYVVVVFAVVGWMTWRRVKTIGFLACLIFLYCVYLIPPVAAGGFPHWQWLWPGILDALLLVGAIAAFTGGLGSAWRWLEQTFPFLSMRRPDPASMRVIDAEAMSPAEHPGGGLLRFAQKPVVQLVIVETVLLVGALVTRLGWRRRHPSPPCEERPRPTKHGCG